MVQSRLLPLFCLFAVLTLAGCSSKDIVSTSQEVEVGQEAARQIEAQYPVSKDSGLNKLVNDTGQTVLRYVPNKREGIEYKFKVLDINEVNAFSLPGGWIYIERGLIEATKGNNHQLAGVIAHEIGHVQARHAAKMMGRSQIYGIAIDILTEGKTQEWANVFANLNLLRWSRKEEYEADKLAVDYLLPSPYNPKGLIDFFKVLLAEDGKGATLPFLQTHPLTQDRIDRLQEYLDEKKAE